MSSKLSDFIARFRRPRRSTPVIQTAWGPVTESARRQAAENMRRDPELRARVVDQLEKEGRSRAVAERVARERYPEAFEGE